MSNVFFLAGIQPANYQVQINRLLTWCRKNKLKIDFVVSASGLAQEPKIKSVHHAGRSQTLISFFFVWASCSEMRFEKIFGEKYDYEKSNTYQKIVAEKIIEEIKKENEKNELG